MKFDHKVKYNGVYYEIGQNVPMEETKETVEKSAEKSADKKSAYSKTEINRMSTSDLKELAKSEGIDSELSGADIKKALINKFEL